jgi:uncharacterized protein YbjT (DUF2867 family)
MILVTGATGELGRHVMDGLLGKVPAAKLVVAVRNVAKAVDFAARGVAVRHADYDQPDTLGAAFTGVPYAFASHFSPAALMQALQAYRSGFKPSQQLDRPYAAEGINVFAAH